MKMIFHNGKNDIVSQHEHHHLPTNCDDESSRAPTDNADGMARLSFLAKDERGGAGVAWAVASLILPLLCSPPLVLGEGRAAEAAGRKERGL